MTTRPSLILVLALLWAGAFSDVARAEHRATRLGDPETRFAPPLQTVEHLRALFRNEKLKADMEAVLRQARWPGNPEDLRRAAATGEIVSVKLPTGTRLPFMSTRRNGKPIALIDVVWAGKEPISAYTFDFVSNDRKYRCITPKLCSNFLVEDLGEAVPPPVLALTKTAPEILSICEPATVSLRVVNAGRRPLTQVQVTDPLPEGWRTTEGLTNLVLQAGTLAPGEGRDFSFNVLASVTGIHVNEAVAVSAEGGRAEASATTEVKAPALTVECVAPGEVLLARPAQVCLTVRNTGEVAEPAAVLTLPLPEGVTVSSVTGGGTVEATAVRWAFGTLPAGASTNVCAVLTRSQPGDIALSAQVQGQCAPAVVSQCATRVAGVPAILLEVVDLEDPIEVGKEVTYEIRVTNQGSSAITNIRIACLFPGSEEFVSGSGETAVQGEGRTATTEVLPTLEAKAVAVWKVSAKALTVDDARFRVELTADQFPRPIEEFEASLLY